MIACLAIHHLSERAERMPVGRRNADEYEGPRPAAGVDSAAIESTTTDAVVVSSSSIDRGGEEEEEGVEYELTDFVLLTEIEEMQSFVASIRERTTSASGSVDDTPSGFSFDVAPASSSVDPPDSVDAPASDLDEEFVEEGEMLPFVDSDLVDDTTASVASAAASIASAYMTGGEGAAILFEGQPMTIALSEAELSERYSVYDNYDVLFFGPTAEGGANDVGSSNDGGHATTIAIRRSWTDADPRSWGGGAENYTGEGGGGVVFAEGVDLLASRAERDDAGDREEADSVATGGADRSTRTVVRPSPSSRACVRVASVVATRAGGDGDEGDGGGGHDQHISPAAPPDNDAQNANVATELVLRSGDDAQNAEIIKELVFRCLARNNRKEGRDGDGTPSRAGSVSAATPSGRGGASVAGSVSVARSLGRGGASVSSIVGGQRRGTGVGSVAGAVVGDGNQSITESVSEKLSGRDASVRSNASERSETKGSVSVRLLRDPSEVGSISSIQDSRSEEDVSLRLPKDPPFLHVRLARGPSFAYSVKQNMEERKKLPMDPSLAHSASASGNDDSRKEGRMAISVRRLQRDPSMKEPKEPSFEHVRLARDPSFVPYAKPNTEEWRRLPRDPSLAHSASVSVDDDGQNEGGTAIPVRRLQRDPSEFVLDDSRKEEGSTISARRLPRDPSSVHSEASVICQDSRDEEERTIARGPSRRDDPPECATTDPEESKDGASQKKASPQLRGASVMSHNTGKLCHASINVWQPRDGGDLRPTLSRMSGRLREQPPRPDLLRYGSVAQSTRSRNRDDNVESLLRALRKQLHQHQETRREPPRPEIVRRGDIRTARRSRYDDQNIRPFSSSSASYLNKSLLYSATTLGPSSVRCHSQYSVNGGERQYAVIGERSYSTNGGCRDRNVSVRRRGPMAPPPPQQQQPSLSGQSLMRRRRYKELLVRQRAAAGREDNFSNSGIGATNRFAVTMEPTTKLGDGITENVVLNSKTTLMSSKSLALNNPIPCIDGGSQKQGTEISSY